MRLMDAVDSGTQRAARYSLTDDEISLSFSIYFTWGYPDYVREAFSFLLKARDKYAAYCPHKELTWRQLRELLEDADSPEVRMVIASRLTTSQSVLNFLANSSNPAVVLRVAENPNTHIATLTRLIRHECPQVRIGVAEHPSTPAVLLHLLACDADADVRLALAENFNMPKAVLEAMLEDENPYVAHRAERSLATPTAAEVVTANFRSTLRRARARR